MQPRHPGQRKKRRHKKNSAARKKPAAHNNPIALNSAEAAIPEASLLALPVELTCMIDAYLPDADRLNLAKTCKAYSFFYRPYTRLRQTFLNHVVRGEQSQVEVMIHQHPSLLLARGSALDYSHREIAGTAFQMALKTGDEEMAGALKAIYLQLYPINGQAMLDAEFNEVFPHGYEVHLQEQEQRATEFEHDYLKPLGNAIKDASIEDLQAALNKEDNGSALCRALTTFRVAFTALSHNEKVFNPNHLQKILNMYGEMFWHLDVVSTNPDHRWLRRDLLWRQIGWEQRFLPANYAQAWCAGLSSIAKTRKPLQRTLEVQNWVIYNEVKFFPLSSVASSGLGWDYAIYTCAGIWIAAVSGKVRPYGYCDKFFQSLIKQKHQVFATFAPQPVRARQRPV